MYLQRTGRRRRYQTLGPRTCSEHKYKIHKWFSRCSNRGTPLHGICIQSHSYVRLSCAFGRSRCTLRDIWSRKKGPPTTSMDVEMGLDQVCWNVEWENCNVIHRHHSPRRSDNWSRCIDQSVRSPIDSVPFSCCFFTHLLWFSLIRDQGLVQLARPFAWNHHRIIIKVLMLKKRFILMHFHNWIVLYTFVNLCQISFRLLQLWVPFQLQTKKNFIWIPISLL